MLGYGFQLTRREAYRLGTSVGAMVGKASGSHSPNGDDFQAQPVPWSAYLRTQLLAEYNSKTSKNKTYPSFASFTTPSMPAPLAKGKCGTFFCPVLPEYSAVAYWCQNHGKQQGR